MKNGITYIFERKSTKLLSVTKYLILRAQMRSEKHNKQSILQIEKKNYKLLTIIFIQEKNHSASKFDRIWVFFQWSYLKSKRC